jgi:hypothetical protein
MIYLFILIIVNAALFIVNVAIQQRANLLFSTQIIKSAERIEALEAKVAELKRYGP